MIPPKVSIGPLTINLYGVIIAVAIYIGWLIAKKRASLSQIPKSLFDDPILVIPLIFGIIGARLYHVSDFWSFYKTDLQSILFIWNGGLGILGGLLGVFLGFWLVSKIRKINFLSLLDLASPSVLLGQAIGRFGNFVNQEAFGPPTSLPWGVYIDPVHRPSQYQTFTHFHPTFFYEAILDFIFFLILLRFSQSPKIKGQTFALYLILYSIGRFIVEFWRIDTAKIEDLKVAHILTVLIFLLGIYLFRAKKKRTP